MYKPGDTYWTMFTTRNASSGASQNADSSPNVVLYRNGSQVSGITVTNVSTGVYKATGTISSGYAKGDVIQVLATATVDGVADKAIIDSFVLDSKRVGDLNDFNHSADTVIVAGVPDVNVVTVDGIDVDGPDDFKADLTTLENRLSEARASYLDKLSISGTLAHTNNASSFMANLTTLETRLSSARAGYLDKLNVVGVLANTDNADLFKADVSALALEASLAALAKEDTLLALDESVDLVHTKIDLQDVEIADMQQDLTDIEAKIDNLDGDVVNVQTDVTNIGLDTDTLLANLAVVDTVVDSIKLQTDKMKFDGSNNIWATGLVNPLIGPGADECTLLIETEGGVPIPDADVWLTLDAHGSTPVAGTLQTNDSGLVTFLLDSGSTYYLWVKKTGYNDIRGQAFVAVAD